MDVEALTKRLRDFDEMTFDPSPELMAWLRENAELRREAAAALAALSADLSLAQAAAETARKSSDHWEARAKTISTRVADGEKVCDSYAKENQQLHDLAEAAEARATALAAEVERYKAALAAERECRMRPTRAALEGKDNA